MHAERRSRDGYHFSSGAGDLADGRGISNYGRDVLQVEPRAVCARQKFAPAIVGDLESSRNFERRTWRSQPESKSCEHEGAGGNGYRYPRPTPGFFATRDTRRSTNGPGRVGPEIRCHGCNPQAAASRCELSRVGVAPQSLQVGPHLRSALVAQVSILLESLMDEASQFRR